MAVTKQTLKAATDTDGLTYEDFEKESARKWKTRKVSEELQKISRAEQKADKTKKALTKKEADQQARERVDKLTPEEQAANMKEWKQAFIDRLKGQGYTKEAATLAGTKGGPAWVDQAPGADDDLFRKIYDGKSYNGYRYPLLKAVGGNLVSDPAWQPETTASFIDKNGKKTYANPNTEYYWVSDGKTYPPGTFAKITGPNGQSVFARALDTNGSKGISANGAGGSRQLEASPALFKALGYEASGTAAPAGNFKVEVFPGSNGGVAPGKLGHLTNEETQEAGKLIQDGKVKSISSKEDLERAKKEQEEKDKKNDPEAPKDEKKAGLLLRRGFASVYHGKEQYEVGYACEDCKHDGGGHVKEGSDTVYVGKYPLSRIADATSDDLNVVSGGLDTWVGGGTTSTRLA